MFQVIQNVRSGETAVKRIPAPIASKAELLIATQASIISAGTERYVVDLAQKSLLGKARQRPEDVKRVLQKIAQEGLISTLSQVKAKLDDPLPLGYSAAGIVLECGAGVQAFKPGDRVASATPHAAVAAVGHNLCAHIPDGVTFEQAAYTSVASIGLQGVRLAKLSLGESVLVIGLGLIGQICVCLLKAQGCRVFGVDLDPSKLELALRFGADQVAKENPLQAVKDFTGGYGPDAVILTAATSSNEPIEFAAEVCRPKGRIVLVGVVGLQIPRPPFFKKELEFTVSSSLGPGRSDPVYEEKGIDYPIGYARWTAQRNMQSVLALMKDGKLPVEQLTTHRFPIERAAEAYEIITKRTEPFLGLLLQYEESVEKTERRLELRPSRPKSESLGVSLIGAGNFGRLIMLPALEKLEKIEWRGICTARGAHAEDTGRRTGFEFASTDVNDILNDSKTDAVLISTRHNLHCEQVIAALGAGKHVFVEKPLCILPEELDLISECVADLGRNCPILMVGFNRRFAPATVRVREFFGTARPLSISFRFSPGYIPADHWTQDEEVGGGRIVGEACHAIDTCAAIAGSRPVKVYAESVASGGKIETSDDRTFITIRHADGSISSVSYQAGGDSAFPAERIEIFGGGKTAVIDAWREVQLWQRGKVDRVSAGKDKGHAEEFAKFIEACRRGDPSPIPWAEIRAVTWASLMAVRSLREGCTFSYDTSETEA